jgi:hypothetical protein
MSRFSSSRPARFARRAAGFFLIGLALSVLIAWALALTHPQLTQTGNAEAVKENERLAIRISKGSWTTRVELVREFGTSWSPIRAAGPPDTKNMGDIPTAWASLTPDAQMEWLELEYAHAVVPREIRVYETNCPGALVHASIFDVSGQQVSVWDGADPATPDAQGIYVAIIPVNAGIATARVQIDLNSPRVPGWNEIDAVALVDLNGGVQWATNVRASSTYAAHSTTGTAGDLSSLRQIAPGFVKLAWQSPAGNSPVSEQRTFEARGLPLPALWGEQPAARALQPLDLRWPIWPGLAIDAAAYGLLMWVLYTCTFGLRRFLRESLRLRRGCCMRCGYDLRFDLASGCPECGWRRV